MRLWLRGGIVPVLEGRGNSCGRNFSATKRSSRVSSSLVHDTHTAATELFDDAVMRDGLADEESVTAMCAHVRLHPMTSQRRRTSYVSDSAERGKFRDVAYLRSSRQL